MAFFDMIMVSCACAPRIAAQALSVLSLSDADARDHAGPELVFRMTSS
ncbi:hypothetical protein [Achromobacter xylosoxidans]|nr:hypothetical protein [Achromobacter xylosoxidans]